MVSDTLRTISKAEKELEHMADNGEKPDETEKALKEMKHLSEQATFSAVRSAETWGQSCHGLHKRKIK